MSSANFDFVSETPYNGEDMIGDDTPLSELKNDWESRLCVACNKNYTRFDEDSLCEKCKLEVYDE